ncbi:unnamed protein product, partial [marine sediment metagenome]
TYPFNDRRRFSGVVDIVRGREENLIDGIRYKVCKVGPRDITLAEVGEGLSLDIDLSRAPLIANSVSLVAIKFTVKHIIDFQLLRDIEETYFDLDYFSHTNVPDMYACIKGDMVIPVVPILPSDAGGFAIILYSPSGYQLISADKEAKETHCAFDYRGNSITSVSGLLWEMSDSMTRQSRDPLSEQIYFENNKFNFGLSADGRMVERVYPSEIRKELDKLRQRVGRPNKFTWIAIGLAAAGFIAAIISIFI